jgi:hypothetical protein
MNIMYNSDRHPYSFVIATCYHMPYWSLNDLRGCLRNQEMQKLKGSLH